MPRTSAVILSVGLLGVAAFPAMSGPVLWRADFTDGDVWLAPREYPSREKCPGGAIAFDIAPRVLSVSGTLTNETDTAWQMETKALPFDHAGRYAYVFSFDSRGCRGANESTPGFENCISWYDRDGTLLERHPVTLLMEDVPQFEYRFVREVPLGAARFKLNVGWDTPNLMAGRSVRIRDLRIEAAGDDEPVGVRRPDVFGPRIRIVSETPTRRVTASAVVSVTDATGVVADSIAVTVDGVVRTDCVRKAVKGGFEVSVPCGASPWSEGLHWVCVRAKDANGLLTDARKCFLIGDRPKTPPVTLRDDGVTLVGGKPFFPIGIYSVNKRDFNAYNWDRAISDLKDGGFNLVHSYTAWPDPAFHAMTAKYGLKMWMQGFVPSKDPMFIDKYRNSPWIIAWYLGDDTSRNTTVSELYDREDNARAVDPTRISAQADMHRPPFELYAPATDVYMPELYPLRCATERENRQCVAVVSRTMREGAAAQARDPYGRPHAIWPIIQQFKGYVDWKRYPTPEEFYGMCFASIVHGAKGITLYTYGGYCDEKAKTFTYGVTGTEAAWMTTTNCMRRIAALSPVLLERTPPQPPAPVVLSGPTHDGVDGPSVSALCKEKDGVRYLFAVNSADAEVRASFAPSARGPVEVLWEDRRLAPDAEGRFVDTFKPLAVHIYRFAGR